MKIVYASLLCLWVQLTCGLPTQTDNAPSSNTNRFASHASQIIATNLLKHYADIDDNQVYSPLGVTSMLAVLAEASAGDTYSEFCKVLGYPEDRTQLRASFNRILTQYKNREQTTEPSFQTWLYIYRNYTARDEFKQLLRDQYLVEVKDINRDEYDWSEPNTSLDLETNSKDVIGFETLKRIKVDSDDESAAASDRVEIKDTYGEEVVDKPASKFDRVVDDKQYVEKPVILEEIKREQQKQQEDEEKKLAAAALSLVKKGAAPEEKQKEMPEATKTEDDKTEEIKEIEAASADIAEIPKQDDDVGSVKAIIKREDEANVEDNETVQVEEKLLKNYNEEKESDMVAIEDLLKANEPEKVSLPLQKLENALDTANKGVGGEIMIALESHLSSVRRVLGARALFRKDDIASALSANSITGRELGSQTKMLLFNGLYYHGNWAHPFVAQGTSEELFYMSADDTMKTPMMHTKGAFNIVELEHLNAKALCLPYENRKYTMLVIVPNDIDGLRMLVEKMQPGDFEYAKSHMTKKDLHITMPRFQAEETTRSEAMLKNLGLQKLFSRTETDLSLLSEDKDLHVDEIVQFVSVRVDEGGSSENALSATTTTQGRNSDAEYEKVEINRPFLYFVMDCDEQFVIAAGKIQVPTVKDESPVAIEIEYEQT